MNNLGAGIAIGLAVGVALSAAMSRKRSEVGKGLESSRAETATDGKRSPDQNPGNENQDPDSN